MNATAAMFSAIWCDAAATGVSFPASAVAAANTPTSSATVEAAGNPRCTIRRSRVPFDAARAAQQSAAAAARRSTTTAIEQHGRQVDARNQRRQRRTRQGPAAGAPRWP